MTKDDFLRFMVEKEINLYNNLLMMINTLSDLDNYLRTKGVDEQVISLSGYYSKIDEFKKFINDNRFLLCASTYDQCNSLANQILTNLTHSFKSRPYKKDIISYRNDLINMTRNHVDQLGELQESL